MNSIDVIILNFAEIRRRSVKLWNGIPNEHYHWKPDQGAFSVIEMIRHVLEAEHLFHVIIQKRGSLGDYESPWEGKEYVNVESELEFAESFRKDFFDTIRSFSENDLESVIIDRKEVGQRKNLGDYLLRTAYHESVHTGQMLDYVRTLGIDRPIIWD